MATAKVLKNDGETVKLGFEDGTFRSVPSKDIGFLAVEGSTVDVYENRDGEKVETMYAPHKAAANAINLGVRESADGKILVNKIAYCLLACFLGGFGAHKFYARKYVQGILYLLFFWTCIPAIIAFIEFIIALTKSPDDDGNIAV